MRITFYVIMGFFAFVLFALIDPNSIIHNYEWFHNVNAQYNTRRSQIRIHKRLLEGNPSVEERSRLNLEIASMKFSCRDLANRYNANAVKMNRSLFKHGTPVSLNPEDCE